MIRLQKFLADAGLVSRRTGEQLIVEGRVTVNGHVVRELGTKVDPVHDQVTLDGKPAKPKRKVYIALNKTRGLVCSHNDELKRPTIYDLLPAEWAHLHSVGRLDFNSEGLLFLTNDG
ncbi:MAG: S4 domain-containing protein, partial [Verrucomicrobia bacterium]|nr:S4 domain-containing protein [Verrucomicrobiota bacterium]